VADVEKQPVSDSNDHGAHPMLFGFSFGAPFFFPDRVRTP